MKYKYVIFAVNGVLLDESRPVRAFDGIELLLKRLRAAGGQLGIVTSRRREEYERDFIHLGLAAYFDAAVCEEDALRHEPEGNLLECYMRGVGARPEEKNTREQIEMCFDAHENENWRPVFD